jgi:3-deoxy-D-manno-octulosonate 8-phosphate phosphatase (KDO 8-P phosphatase)
MLTKIILSKIKLIAFDFDGVFTDNFVYTNEEGLESVRCCRSDGLGLIRLQALGIKVIIISTESNPVVAMRANKLKVPFIQGVEDKADAIKTICSELNLNPNQSMFVGNDINDISAFKVVGVPVGVADSYPEIYPYIIYRCKKPGGFGAVREICDLVFNSRNT